MTGSVRIGTSGWAYPHWSGNFYPTDVPRERWLEHYAGEFDTVELNNPFYRLPDAAVFDTWAERVPAQFRYAIKASRYLTHVKRLREPQEPLDRFWSRARRLKERLGPTLYQLPPRWSPDRERLESFLAVVPDEPQAIEFRDRRWYAADILALLDRAGFALCLHDMRGSASPRQPVGPLVYVRFHGFGTRYGGAYSPQMLSAWAGRIAEWAGDGMNVWAFFNNDLGGHAPHDADRLRSYVARRLGTR